LLSPEVVVNNPAFFMMQQQQFHKAEDLFKMNIKNYPSGNVAYGYLGNLYAKHGDKKRCRAN